MRSRVVFFWLAVLFLFSGGMLFCMGWRMISGANALESERTAQVIRVVKEENEAHLGERLGEFTLIDDRGEPFGSKDLLGKVWIASFFFTRCPSACRMQNTQVANLQRDFQSQNVHFVSITCDPQRDTPDVLAQYADLFNADAQKWHFLTGDLDYIKRIGTEMMQVSVEEEQHSSRLIVLDQAGIVRGTYSSMQPDKLIKLKQLVGELLAEHSAPKKDGTPAPGL